VIPPVLGNWCHCVFQRAELESLDNLFKKLTQGIGAPKGFGAHPCASTTHSIPLIFSLILRLRVSTSGQNLLILVLASRN